MDTTLHSEHSESERAASQPEHSLVESLAAKLGSSADARTVYAAPVERDGITVIPVAKVRYGFGGGGKVREGSSGGGGAQITPVGYIEVKAGGATYKPIPDPADTARIILAGSLAGLIALRLLTRLFHA